MSSKIKKAKEKSDKRVKCGKCEENFQHEEISFKCMGCNGFFHPSCEVLVNNECESCISFKAYQSSNGVGNRSVEEMENLCPVCEEVCTCGPSSRISPKKRKASPRNKSPMKKSKIQYSSSESSLSDLSNDDISCTESESEVSSEDEEEVIGKVSLMEDPTEALTLLWSSEEEEEKAKSPPKRAPAAKVDTEALKTPVNKVTNLAGKSILSGMSKEKLVAQLNNLPANVLATLGAAARKEIQLKKPSGSLKSISNRPLSRQESIQLITELLSANTAATGSASKPVNSVANKNKKKIVVPKVINPATGTLPKGTKLVTNSINENELKLSLENALYETDEEDEEIPEETKAYDVNDIINVETLDSRTSETITSKSKVPIGTFRRSRRLSQPFLILSNAIKTSVLQQNVVCKKRRNGSSIHSLLTPTLSATAQTFPCSPVLTPLKDKRHTDVIPEHASNASPADDAFINFASLFEKDIFSLPSAFSDF